MCWSRRYVAYINNLICGNSSHSFNTTSSEILQGIKVVATMKTLLMVAIFVFCSKNIYSQTTCRNNCQDFLGTPMCTLMKQKCGSSSMGIFCQKSCKICTSCPESRSLKRDVSTACQLGVCADTRNSLWCTVMQQRMKDGCVVFGNQCKATCGLCKPCALPPTELACTNNCEDFHPKPCIYWKKQGYCDVKKGFPHTRIACPLSCGTCKLCPTEPPTTTTKDCAKCEDKHKFCGYWKKEGYCDVTKGFPDTLKACPKTCEVCKPCLS